MTSSKVEDTSSDKVDGLPSAGQGTFQRGCAFPTLVCNKGKPEVCLQDLTESCDIEACILQHERKHLEDIALEHIDVCDGREDGQLAQTPLSRKVLLERSAINVEKTCLRQLLIPFLFQ